MNEKLTPEKVREDFDLFLVEMGMNRQLVERISTNEADLVEFPPPYQGLLDLRESSIQGLGLFALRSFASGQVIAPGRIGWQRTPAGRFINHSPQPNAEGYLHSNGDLYVRALRDIAPGDEMLLDYRQMAVVNSDALRLVQKMSQGGGG